MPRPRSSEPSRNQTPTWATACLSLLAALFAQTATALPLPPSVAATLPSDTFVPDFSYAGYRFGLEPLPRPSGKIFDVTSYGAKANDGIDDTAALQKTLEAAKQNQGWSIVRFPAGRFIISEIIELDRSDLILRGAGRGTEGTTLYFPRPLAMVDDKGKLDELRDYLIRYDKRQKEPKNNLDVLFSEYSWSGGFIWVGRPQQRTSAYLEENDQPIEAIASSQAGKRGEKTLTVSDSYKLSTSDRIQILWYNRAGEHGPLIHEIYGDTDEKIGAHHWSFPDRPLVYQRTQITAIEGKQITIADPLLHNLSSEVPAEIADWTPLERVGIEDLRIEFPDSPFFGHHVEQGYNGIQLADLADGWARSLTFVNADSGVLTYDSANLTISDIQTLGDRKGHYSVHMGNVHNVLAERIQVFNPVIHPLSFNTQCTRSVYKDAEVFRDGQLDQHAGSNHQNLFDNVTLHVSAKQKGETLCYPAFEGSGAGYWQPGHGQFNTTWNLRILVTDGAYADEPMVIQGLAEGPDARIFGLSGNREFSLDYRPAPVASHLNQRIEEAPSLYEYQRQIRLQQP